MKHERNSCLDGSQKVLFYLGLWPVNERQGGLRFFLMRIVFPRAIIFRFCYSIVFQAINVSIVWGNVYLTVEYSLQVMFYLMLGTKYLSIFINRHKIRNLFNDIEMLNEKLVSGSKLNKVLLTKNQKICTLINKASIPLAILAGGLTIVILLPIALKNRTIPLRLWFPHDISYTPMYELTLMTACVLGMADVGIVIICDTLFCIIVLQLVCHFQMLRTDLENISEVIDEKIAEEKAKKKAIEDVLTKNTDTGNTTVNIMKPAEESRIPLNTRVKGVVEVFRTKCGNKRNMRQAWVNRCQADFVRNHYILIKLTKDVQLIFKHILTCQLIINLSQAVNGLYISTLAKSLDPKVMVIVGSIVIGLAESLAFCMCAGYLSDESMKLHYAAFACDWVLMPKTFKSSLCIIMSRTQRAFSLRAAGIPLSRRTCRTISKATYYLHTLLHKIYFGEKFIQTKIAG